MGLIVRLELMRQSLREKMLPTVGSNDYHLLSGVLALIFAGGTLATGFATTGATLPLGGFSFVATFITGLLAILTIVLLPVGLLLL